ncbi:hypothetical protein NUM_64710 [Actinocatenispora comari]|uniref:Uncharacterized protein n=1 Tax=Actinocatenispora comari TaxID=2807577 RepID=A0A8J4AKT5_9ACTN|nr:hypothetical protein NUM_64710 [Actinocatenispora comari]
MRVTGPVWVVVIEGSRTSIVERTVFVARLPFYDANGDRVNWYRGGVTVPRDTPTTRREEVA